MIFCFVCYEDFRLICFSDASIVIEHSMTDGNINGEESTVSFALGDPDDGDEIVVDMFYDPIYNTFAFDTVAGTTRCYHESGTTAGEGKHRNIFFPFGRY